MTSLVELAIGQHGRIVSIDGNDAVAVRLLEMGLTLDESITCLGYAPLGDPIEYSVRGYRITLRAREAERVSVDTERTEVPD